MNFPILPRIYKTGVFKLTLQFEERNSDHMHVPKTPVQKSLNQSPVPEYNYNGPKLVGGKPHEQCIREGG